MAIELFNDGKHICLMFNDLVGAEEAAAVQANQFLIVSDGEGALIDPAGNMTYNALLIAMQKYFPYKSLKYIFASHQDPDIVASLNRWLSATDCTLYVSRLWARFVPHFCTLNRAEGRVASIPDEGMKIAMRDTIIHAVPAHFLHAEGNFQFYDRKSRILFSGDMGASLLSSAEVLQPIRTKEEFRANIPAMADFHVRYMVSNKVCRYWVRMVRNMDVAMLVPQHGRYFIGREAINAFLDWIETLECGIDLFTQNNYRFPA